MKKRHRIASCITAVMMSASFFTIHFSVSVFGNDEDITAFPPQYSLEQYGYLTPARSQADTSTCWAHAALASVESNLLMKGMAGADIDLSEAHLTWFALHGPSENPDDPLFGDGIRSVTDVYDDENGSNRETVTSVLARGSGVCLETEGGSIYQRPEFSEDQRYLSIARLKNCDWLNPEDISSVKEHLMKNGAVMAGFYYSDCNYSVQYNSYRVQTPLPANHAVAIVGWDDGFSRYQFPNIAEADGAWICKNSSAAGNRDGFFYLSYYDASLADFASFEMDDVTSFGSVYQYDGMYRDCRIGRSQGIAGANIFTASRDDILTSVGFFTDDKDVPYTISIYTDLEKTNCPMKGTKAAEISGVMPFGGYHTLDLNVPVEVSEGTVFSVVLQLPKDGSRLCLDDNNTTLGRSYYLDLEEYTTENKVWKDLGTRIRENICIKVFTACTDDICEILPPAETETVAVTETETETETEPATEAKTEPLTESATETETEPETEATFPSETETTVPEKMDGDCNGDGRIGIVDLVYAQKCLLRVIPVSPSINLDVNHDNVLDAFDLALLKWKLLHQ